MTDQELRKLGRGDLLQMLLEQSKENQRLQEELNAAKAELADRSIKIDEAGSIAEASLQLNGIFEAAQMACQQYTDNIKELSQRQEMICSQREKESKEQAARLVADAEKRAAELERITKQQCDVMLAAAKTQSQQYWDEVSGKLNAFVEEHAELRQLLSAMLPQSRKN